LAFDKIIHAEWIARPRPSARQLARLIERWHGWDRRP
jgi:hypothetical protein